MERTCTSWFLVQKMLKEWKIILVYFFLFSSPAYSQICNPAVPTYTVNLTGYNGSGWISPLVVRNDYCCGSSNPDRCIQFIITLDPLSQQGIIFDIFSGAVPPGALYYQVNCSPPVPVGSPLCLTGVGPHMLTFCKPGNNANEYIIRPIPIPKVGPPRVINQGCSTTLYVFGLSEPTITWTSIYPGAVGAYNNPYLSSTSGQDTVRVTAQPGAPPYVDYRVCGTPIGSCTPSTFCDTVRVYFNTTLNVQITPVVPTVCAGSPATWITATATGGTPPYSYLWNTGDTSRSIFAGPGTYTVAVKDTSNCPPVSTTITVTTTTVTVAVTASHAACKFSFTGTASAIPSGGISPYTYSWSTSPLQTSATATGLPAGTYTVTVNDSQGCTARQTVTITEPLLFIATISGLTHVTCNGLSNGSISVSASGGTSPYTYSWSPSGGTGANASGLPAGTYIVTVRDANGCQALANQTITEPPVLTVTPTQVNIVCNGGNTGSATVTPSGGTPLYTYLWSPSAGGQTTATATGLLAGTYSVVVTDAKGCRVTQTFFLNQPLMTLTVTPSHVSCNGGNNGNATANVSGGTPLYTYSWSSGGPSNVTATGLSVGTYTLTVRDANNCPSTTTFTITQPPLLLAPNTVTHATCPNDSNGTITVSPSGGVVPYAYLWPHNGSSASPITGLPAGTYSYTVTDSKGCKVTASATITQPAPIILVTGFTNATCGFNNGSVSVSASGGITPYTYVWLPGGATTASVSGLGVGTYTVVVTQATGCTQKATVSINNISGPSSFISGNTSVSCRGGNNGSLSVSVTGGTPPYTYSWSPYGGNGIIATGLSAGVYYITVRDNNGCVSIISDTIKQPALLFTVTSINTPVLCNGGNSGVVNVNAFGGVPPYSYLWSPGGSTASSASGLPAGTYTSTVTDSKGCQSVNTITLSQPTLLTAATAGTTPANCSAANGTATVSVSGGTSPYTYSWSPGGGSSPTAIGLNAGTYTVSIRDANGCLAVTTAVISQVFGLSASATPVHISCYGGSNGSITVAANGGRTPYTYLWSPAVGSGTSASGLTSGTYQVMVTDSFQCQYALTVAITQPPALSGNTTVINSVCTLPNGKASAVITGGVAPYTFSWSPSGGNAALASGLAAGNYTVTVTDTKGCTFQAPAVITNVPGGKVFVSSTNVLCNGASNGSANATVTGGTFPYTYLWSPSNKTTATATGLPAGTFTVLITDANGCRDSATGLINQPQLLTSTATIVSGITCYNANNAMATVSATGGVSPYTYSWSTIPVQANPTASNLAGGTYVATVTDNNGCKTQASVTISNVPLLVTSLNTVINATCSNACNGSISTSPSGGTPPYQYQWSTSPVQVTANSINLCAGSYTVIVTDKNLCTNTLSAIVGYPVVNVSINAPPPVCIGQSITLSASGSGGAGPYAYTWLPNGPTVSPVSTTTYTVIVSDASGCASVPGTVTVQVHPPLSVTIKGKNTICIGSTTRLSAQASGGNGGPYTYLWMPGSIRDSAITVSISSTTTYTVIATDNCSPSASNRITVTAQPRPVVSFTSNAVSRCDTVCAQFISTSSPPAVSWSWEFGDGKKSNLRDPLYCYTTPGVFSVKLSITDSIGCSNSITNANMITVYGKPAADFEMTPNATTILEPKICFKDKSSPDVVSWYWNFGDKNNSETSAVQNPCHAYSDTGTYCVSLIVHNINQCWNTVTYCLTIQPYYALYVPNAFTPNGDGINETFYPMGYGLDESSFEMVMFDRWGNEMFETKTWGKGWDGRANGGSDIAQQDVYVWKIRIKDYTGSLHILTGIVSLIK